MKSFSASSLQTIRTSALVVTQIMAVVACASALARPFDGGSAERESDSMAKKPLALVYAGPGACVSEGCDQAAGAIAESRGFRVRYISETEISPSLLKTARLWIQPGGNAIDAARALGLKRMEMIREFIAAGGRYLGFCAGGFLADQFVDDPQPNLMQTPGLGIITSESYDFTKSPDAMILPIVWLGQTRHMYFQGGPAFKLKSPAAVTVIAYYPDNAPAVIMESFGAGRVAVTGPHPEAPQDWFDADKLKKIDGLDAPYAAELLDRLFSN